MHQELKDKFPTWVNDPEHGKYNLCCSNDLDSLVSCALLRELKGYPINYFYDFRTLYKADREDNRKAIGVDMALASSGRCWDNHVTLARWDSKSNPMAANPNNIFNINAGNKTEYVKKYAMSTTLLIYSYYDIPLPKSTEAQKILLAIDTGHQGH